MCVCIGHDAVEGSHVVPSYMEETQKQLSYQGDSEKQMRQRGFRIQRGKEI